MMTNEEICANIERTINAASKKEYGENYEDHLFNQYQLYLNSADKISDRRQTANAFFLTLNTGLMTAIGFSGFFEKSKIGLNKDFACFLTGGILIFCYVWYRLIRSYKGLNSAKFKVIDVIEKQLPLRLFHAEWEALAKGKSQKIYLPFSKLEIYLPLSFGLLYLFMLIYLLIFKT